MPYPKKVRLHVKGVAKPTVETFARFCMANGDLTREQGVALLAEWEQKKYIVKRPDGGWDVLKAQPRQRVRRA